MILLDTNVLSALMQRSPDVEVVQWLDRQPRSSIWTTAVTLFEVRFGLQVMPFGRRRSSLIHAFERLVSEVLQDRVAQFDAEAARQAADLMAKRMKKGRSGELRDTMIAGIALASHATIATRNMKHFDDLSATIVNPWEA
ncbi:MAG TPA: type II toxin-antitoxin system VapC family toxin [Silvibacterium sp.]|jgi:predicted nucleic acid-binding protein|nr:type II toxin-antitoxin system VapC family toxin [Silvibacterium sp.]